MVDASGLVGWALAAMAAAGVVYTFLAAFLVGRRQHPQPRPDAMRRPGVTLLKPLHLDEAGLEDNLRSFFAQDYDGPIQIVFGARSQSDAALQIAQKLRGEYATNDVGFIVDTSFKGPNPKIANLVNMVGHARHEILIVSDSDIRVSGDYVRTIVAELERPNVGAVTCLYSGKPLGNLWSVLEAMNIDYGFLPNAICGTSLGLAKPCFGATIALRQSTLEEIGGFGAVSRLLADDYEIGRAIRATGQHVNISSIVVEHVCSEKRFADLVRHELRWARTIRLLNAPGHFGSILTHALPLALIAGLLWAPTAPALGLVSIALGARLWLAWCVRSTIGTRAGSLWLLPVRDMLSFIILFASFFGNSVYWRGTRYLTRADGVLAQQ